MKNDPYGWGADILAALAYLHEEQEVICKPRPTPRPDYSKAEKSKKATRRSRNKTARKARKSK